MSYQVKVYSAWSEDIPAEIKEEYAYTFKDSRNVLVISRFGKIVHTEADGGEPEDNSFLRDGKWIAEQLEAAYQYGRDDEGEF